MRWGRSRRRWPGFRAPSGLLFWLSDFGEVRVGRKRVCHPFFVSRVLEDVQEGAFFRFREFSVFVFRNLEVDLPADAVLFGPFVGFFRGHGVARLIV